MKTRKSITKRFKITKSGKILHLPQGQNHFRSKKTGKKIRQSKKMLELDKTVAKKIKKVMFFAPRRKKVKTK